MAVRTVRDDPEASLLQAVGKCPGIVDHLLGIDLELRPQGFTEGHGLGRDHVHEGPALEPGKHRRIQLLRQLLVVGEDQPTPGAPQGLVGRGRHHMGVREGIGIDASRHQARIVGDVGHQKGTDRVCDLAEAGEVDVPRIRRPSRDDHLGPFGQGQFGGLVIVDQIILGPHGVMHRPEPLARLVDVLAVGQVTACRQVHAHEGIPGRQGRHEDRLVGLAAGMGLHVGIVAPEQGLGPFDGQDLSLVHHLAATIVALARIALGVLVRQHRPLGLKHCPGDDVFGGDQLDLFLLAAELSRENRGQRGVGLGHRGGKEARRNAGDEGL